jgi:hypothetical protein
MAKGAQPKPRRPVSIAIVVPWFQAELTQDERISLRHLAHFLGDYDTYIVAPTGLKSDSFCYQIRRFDERYFEDLLTYSRLMLSAEFYRQFSAYDYILVHQLDCLVFSPDLSRWGDLGFDYIGAPWVRSDASGRKRFTRVGNGGLSLRRVESCLRVIEATGNGRSLLRSAKDLLFTELDDLGELAPAARWRKRLSMLRELNQGPEWYISRYSVHEDRFWSDRARLFFAGFKIPPVAVGLRFSFECEPRFCFEQAGRQLPFGCHGWAKQDRSFWEPYLLPA